MIRLVVNAEEFGATPAGDRDTLRAHRDGVVTSTSILGNCEDIGRVCSALSEAPLLGTGLSLALIGGAPIAKVEEIPGLLSADGKLRTSPAAFAIDWFRNLISPEQVEREMEAQIIRAVTVGLPIDHLCTRGHLGFLPGVGQILERVARRHGIVGIRTSVESPTLAWFADPRRGIEAGILGGLSWLTRKRLGSLRHGPQTWGYLESGRLDEVRIIEIIGRLTPGAHELICHPAPPTDGTNESRELRALTSTKVKTALDRRGIVLCRWRDLF